MILFLSFMADDHRPRLARLSVVPRPLSKRIKDEQLVPQSTPCCVLDIWHYRCTRRQFDITLIIFCCCSVFRDRTRRSANAVCAIKIKGNTRNAHVIIYIPISHRRRERLGFVKSSPLLVFCSVFMARGWNVLNYSKSSGRFSRVKRLPG